MNQLTSVESRPTFDPPWWLAEPAAAHVPDALAAAQALLRRSGWTRQSAQRPEVYSSPTGIQLHLQSRSSGTTRFDPPRAALSGLLITNPGSQDELVQAPNPNLTDEEQTAVVWSWIQLHGNGYRPSAADQLADWLDITAANTAIAETGYPRVQWEVLSQRAMDTVQHMLLSGERLPDSPPRFISKPWDWKDSMLAGIAFVITAGWFALLAGFLMVPSERFGDFALAWRMAGTSVLGVTALAAYTTLHLTQAFGIVRLGAHRLGLATGRITGRGWRHGLKYVPWAEQACRQAPLPVDVLSLRAYFGPLAATTTRTPITLSGVTIAVAGEGYAYLAVAEDIAVAIERLGWEAIPNLKPPGSNPFRQTVLLPTLTSLAWDIAQALEAGSPPDGAQGSNPAWDKVSDQVSGLFAVYMTLLDNHGDHEAIKSVITELMGRQPQPLEPWRPAAIIQ